jgi:AraC family transcriptional regulator
LQYYRRITEDNKLVMNKPQNTDIIYYSELKEWFTPDAFRSFSIKYVLEQTIYYKIGKTEYAVKNGNFLLSQKQPDVKAYFHSPGKMVKSICIDICPQTASEVFTILNDKNDPQFENYLAKNFSYPGFAETIAHATGSVAGNKLAGIAHQVALNKEDLEINKEWFYELLECIVQQEHTIYRNLSQLKHLKLSTRKEILKRLGIAMEYMDEHFLTIENINEIAKVCAMSEYHFYRSFKQVYHNTPHQYLLQKKLHAASEMIACQDILLNEVATNCGFPDIATFSKAFKKHFDVSPSAFRKQAL